MGAQLVRRGAAGLLALVLAIAVVEVLVRSMSLAPDVKLIDVTDEGSVYKRSTNPILGFELKASYRNDRADLVRTYPSTNAHGQRDVERTIEKPPGVERILLLGASVVEGFGIRDLHDTISRRLERMYEDGGTEVLNFGVSAYCTAAKVELLRVKGLAFAPDRVVLVFTPNDFRNFNHEAFQLGSPIERPALVEELFLRSHTFRFFATRLNWFYFGTQIDPIEWNRRAIGDNNVVEGLRRLAEMAREHDFAPLVAIWPEFTNRAIVDLHFMPGTNELVVERLARLFGLPSFRFSTHFGRHLATVAERVSPNRLYTLGDRIHPNRESCGLAAAALKAELDRRAGEGAPIEVALAEGDTAAIEVARELGRIEPEMHRIVMNLGNTLLSQGRLDEAIEQYRRTLEIEPDHAEAHSNLGVALKAKGELDQAIRHYRRAVEIDPELADAHNNLGVALAGKGQLTEAAKHFRRAVEIRPDHAEARRNLEAVTRPDAPAGAGS